MFIFFSISSSFFLIREKKKKMEGVFKKTLNHSANQEFYQSANLTQFHENQEERELLSPEDEYYFSNYEQYETALFAKQTNVTTNINTSTTKKKEPRKIKREPHNASNKLLFDAYNLYADQIIYI